MAKLIPRNSAEKRPCLIQYSGAKIGRRFDLTSSVNIIGSSTSVEVVIADNSVLEKHAKITLDKGSIVIIDLSRSQATFVNELPIENQRNLRDGDIIRIGKIMLKIFTQGLDW